MEDSGQIVAPLGLPSAPITDWEAVSKNNATDMGKNIPCVTTGTVYTYLANHVGKDCGDRTFKALMRGYTHLASGRVESIEVNNRSPQYCHMHTISHEAIHEAAQLLCLVVFGTLRIICLS